MGMSLGGGDEEEADVADINVTPFIDVMLVLLIVFMIAAPLSTVDVPVNLPGATTQPQERPEEPMWLSLNAGGELYLGNDLVPLDNLQTVLDLKTGEKRDTTVFFRADKDIAYGELMAVMDGLRGAGYLKVALVGLEGGPTAAAAAAGAPAP